MKDILVQTVPVYVQLIASLMHADTRTEPVLPVFQVGWVTTVAQVFFADICLVFFFKFHIKQFAHT